jgi:hypothetical protein
VSDVPPDKTAGVRDEGQSRRGSRWWYLVLVPSFIGLLWIPFYDSEKPELLGFPFFYWYQFAWVPITALLTWIAFRKVK